VFAAPEGDGWRVRYFSPEAEVAFCGHATIALGSVLAKRQGDGSFPLRLNTGHIRVEAVRSGDMTCATLTCPSGQGSGDHFRHAPAPAARPGRGRVPTVRTDRGRPEASQDPQPCFASEARSTSRRSCLRNEPPRP
jgi:hypothetical protein